MRRPWPGEIVWYRVWGIGLLAVPVLLLFVDWFFAIFLSGCVMGAYAALLPLVYDGEWTRDADGDSVWLPKEPQSSETSWPPLHVIQRRETRMRQFIRNTLWPLIFCLFVVTALAYTAIETLLAGE
jgi:hypothetical protein